MSDNATTVVPLVNETGIIHDLEQGIVGITSLDPAIVDLLVAATIMIIAVILAKAVKYFIVSISPRLAKRTKSSLDDEFFKAVNGPLQWLIVTLGVYLGVKTVNSLPAAIADNLNNVLIIVLLFIGAYLLSNIVNGLVNWYKKDIAHRTQSDLDDVLMPFLSKMASAVIYIVATLMSLAQLGIEITPLIASLGVVGVAVALAAQEMLSNVFGAFSIMTDRPYKTGDRILLGEGEFGDVLEIGLRSTRIKTLDGTVIVMPNANISRSRIINYSMPDTSLRFVVKVGIAYDSDVEKATAIIIDIIDKMENVLKDPKPRVYVSGFGNYSVNLTVHFWSTSYKLIDAQKDEVYRKMLKRFAVEGIEIPYPITTVMLQKPAMSASGLVVEPLNEQVKRWQQ